MRVLFYSGVALVLFAIFMAASYTGSTTDIIAVFDWLFIRGAVVVFLYLLWRFVSAYESNKKSPEQDT